MTYTERARALRPYIVKASASLTDADAVKAKELYDRWAAGMSVEVNDRLVYADRLYRVTQAHTTQEGWEPDKVPALFTVIDETHAGTRRKRHGVHLRTLLHRPGGRQALPLRTDGRAAGRQGDASVPAS